MANWYGTARSNYFKVKNEAAFRKWAEQSGLEVLEGKEAPKINLFAITPNSKVNDSGGWPGWRKRTENDQTTPVGLNAAETVSGNIELAVDDEELVQLDIVQELAGLIEPDQIVVLMEVGNERLRYVTGHATAFNSEGKQADLDLSDIYTLAARKFKVPSGSITQATY